MMDKVRLAFHDALAVILQAVMVTMLVVLGYVVAPVLFAELSSKTAGDIAGTFFTIAAITSILLLAFLAASSCYRRQSLKQRWHWLTGLVIMVVLLLGITPWMAQIKAQYPAGITQEAIDWPLFAALHGVYQLSYLAVIFLMLFGILKILRLHRAESPERE